jgi:lipopolysaccharide transport system ATP-binding protein
VRGSGNSYEFSRDEELGTFDPGLESESTSEYEQIGAEIRNVRILNSRGEVVNILVRGGEYVYTYDVHFSEDAYGVLFGMMIKTGTGLEISGQVSHAARDVIEHIPALHRAQVVLPFEARLASGTYFVNAGVMAVRDGEMKYLHRILDAVAFRIEAVESDMVTGRIDLTLEGNRVEIFPPE